MEEQRLLAEFQKTAVAATEETPSSGHLHHHHYLSSNSLQLALSLISNPFTSQTTLHSLFKILTATLQNPNRNPKPKSIHHEKILSLLSAAVSRHNQHHILTAVRTFALSNSTPTPSLARCLSIIFNNNADDIIDEFADESVFLSLCFQPCKASLRNWLLRNVNKFRLRPSVLLTVLLGFTKDPYPYTRKAALDGLALLCKFVAVEDQSLIQGCYFRAVELLFDSEDSVRCSAVRVVSGWGQLIVACNKVEHNIVWSDALFVQLCSVVRDMSMMVRVEAFNALAGVRIVSEDILLQTLSKKASSAIKDKSYPGQYTAKVFELPASSTAFAFVHGLEDEFSEVRRSACCALGTLTALSSDFAFEAVNLLMDMLNDDSIVVRLQALETMHRTGMSGYLKVQGGHLHMLLGTLVDCSTLIRAACRSVLRLTKMGNLTMFKSSFEGLVKNLELYPQDEADIFFALFNIGKHHGKFVSQTIQEASAEIEPSFGGMLGYENARTVALLVLAVSAPVSIEKSICSIPATIFSYAVTLLGRISRGLAGTLSMNDLLVYLSHCSRFTFVSVSEFFEGEGRTSPVVKCDMQLWQRSYEFHQSQFEKILQLKKGVQSVPAYKLEVHEAARKAAMIMLLKVGDVWTFVKCGCLDEVTRTLRSWKKELMIFMSGSLQSVPELGFTLQYLKMLKFLGKVWMNCIFPMMAHSSGIGMLEILLRKLERSIRGMRSGFTGLNKEANLHIMELIIVSCTLKISYAKEHCPGATLKKLYSTISCVERLHEGSSSELPSFIMELRKTLDEIGAPSNGALGNPFLLRKSLEFFSLRPFELSETLKQVKAELEVCNNSYENPLHFISGLPVGIQFEIKLYNVYCENRIWLKMSMGEKLTQFVFLDLEGASSSDEIKKFTFVAPFYGTPKASYFTLNVCIVMECSSEQVCMVHNYGGPKHKLMNLCRDQEVYLCRLVN